VFGLFVVLGAALLDAHQHRAEAPAIHLGSSPAKGRILSTLAAEMERAMAAANEDASGIASDTPPWLTEFDRYGSLEWRNHQN
jgi:hypothetical protein